MTEHNTPISLNTEFFGNRLRLAGELAFASDEFRLLEGKPPIAHPKAFPFSTNLYRRGSTTWVIQGQGHDPFIADPR